MLEAEPRSIDEEGSSLISASPEKSLHFSPSTRVTRLSVRHGVAGSGQRSVPEEVPVAIVHDGGTTAVMLATPADIEDFAIGFSLSEGIAERASDIVSLDVLAFDDGIEARMWLRDGLGERLAARRRHLAGATGCGLCGIDSLSEAVRPAREVTATATFTPSNIQTALAALSPAQALGAETHAVHAAACWFPERGMIAFREDVGRHNALDKLAGTLARAEENVADGIVLLTSRVSVEMVQKAAVIGTGVLVAVSAPTSLAVRVAEAAGITLIGIARADGFEVFTHPQRIALRETSDGT